MSRYVLGFQEIDGAQAARSADQVQPDGDPDGR
jgi:hypothetical protein